VSNPANQNNTETAPKLLRYLIREQHWSPFEMVHMTMEIKTTRDIARQILRHRSFSFQEFSQRYAVATEFETREARLQDEKNRQNSVETDDRDLNEWWQMQQKKVQGQADLAYQDALAKGIAKEQARALLPEGLTQSTLYMSGTLRSWIHYCELRRGNGTQKEHALIADKCWEIIGVHFPDIVEALND
jgi:thymidylate synthase (FAD)